MSKNHHLGDSDKEHSRISPSASGRWSKCTASIKKSEDLREQGIIGQKETAGSGKAAAEGTYMHDLSEEWIRHQLGDKTVIPMENPDVDLKVYIDHCLGLVNDEKLDKEVFTEMEVDLFYADDTLDEFQRGTADFVILHSDRKNPSDPVISIRDLKWGHIPVYSERNTQLAIYGLSVVEHFKKVVALQPTDNVSLAIVQPRLGHEIEEWVLSIAELQFFTMELQDAVENIRREANLMFAPGDDTCRFCPAKAHCAARLGPVVNTIALIPADAVDASDVPEEDRYALWKNRKRIETVLREIDQDYQWRAKQGNAPSGTKMVMGRSGNRQWKDEVEAAVFINSLGVGEDKMYKAPTLQSPAQIDKYLTKEQKKQLQEHWFKPKGKETLVAEDDPRDAVPTLAEDFLSDDL